MANNLKDVHFNDSDFHKSSDSTGKGKWCVEVANKEGVIAVRDSKDPSGPVLRFSQDEWRAFVSGVKKDEFNV